MGAQIQCKVCKREHYTKYKACPFCAVKEGASEETAAYTTIGTRQTWDGQRETVESPSFADPTDNTTDDDTTDEASPISSETESP